MVIRGISGLESISKDVHNSTAANKRTVDSLASIHRHQLQLQASKQSAQSVLSIPLYVHSRKLGVLSSSNAVYKGYFNEVELLMYASRMQHPALARMPMENPVAGISVSARK